MENTDPITQGVTVASIAADDAFDIGGLMTMQTEELAIVSPVTGVPTTWRWTLAGPGHPASVAVSDAQAADANRLGRLRQAAQVNREDWQEPEKTPEQVRNENVAAIAARVLGWTHAKINGVPYDFSRENVVKLLLDPNCGKIYNQLVKHFNAERSFTHRSAKG